MGIMGSTSYRWLRCDRCGQRVPRLLRTDTRDHAGRRVREWLCDSCVDEQKAIRRRVLAEVVA